MNLEGTRAAYARRAEEYTELLGTMSAVAQEDRHRVEQWASGTAGRILDLGCGPGHWTAHLNHVGHEADGIDPVGEFIDVARRQDPRGRYRIGTLEDLASERHRYDAVLAWYSLIHIRPSALAAALEQVRTLLAPRGRLLLAFFDGPQVAPFDHAVTGAFTWPAQKMSSELNAAGFEVLDIERRRDRGVRPHAAISARRS